MMKCLFSDMEKKIRLLCLGNWKKIFRIPPACCRSKTYCDRALMAYLCRLSLTA